MLFMLNIDTVASTVDNTYKAAGSAVETGKSYVGTAKGIKFLPSKCHSLIFVRYIEFNSFYNTFLDTVASTIQSTVDTTKNVANTAVETTKSVANSAVEKGKSYVDSSKGIVLIFHLISKYN